MNLFFLTSRQQFTDGLTTYNMTRGEDNIKFHFDPAKMEFYTDRDENMESPWRYIGTAAKRDIDAFRAAFVRKMEREPQTVNHLTVRAWFRKFMNGSISIPEPPKPPKDRRWKEGDEPPKPKNYR